MANILATYTDYFLFIETNLELVKNNIVSKVEDTVHSSFSLLDGVKAKLLWENVTPTELLLTSIQDIVKTLDDGLTDTQKAAMVTLIDYVAGQQETLQQYVDDLDDKYVTTGYNIFSNLSGALGAINTEFAQIHELYTQGLTADTTLLDITLTETMSSNASILLSLVQGALEDFSNYSDDLTTYTYASVDNLTAEMIYISQDIMSTIADVSRLTWAHTDQAIQALYSKLHEKIQYEIDNLELHGQPLMVALNTMYSDIEQIQARLNIGTSSYREYLENTTKLFEHERTAG